ncbi:MAG: pyridoxamine 5'-phosphate oxidase [Thalassolituus sp.]|nr:MAG: pyridoxamine 5'-phosphate oxidase [Thalassolituus sp.]
MANLYEIRREYTQGRLDETTAADNPMTQFHAWFEAQKAELPDEPTVMTLASCDAGGQPWQRIVLLKSYDEQGFVFFTNYTSNKGRHLEMNPRASLHFSWLVQERQVMVQGVVSKISREETTAYFHSRPRESQLGAWASHQSQPLADRATLEARFAQLKEEYEGKEIPVPDHWGGYRLSPHRLEFWQGGEARLHDRLEYVVEGQGWHKQRLNP